MRVVLRGAHRTGGALALLVLSLCAQGAEHIDSCDGPQTSWTIANLDVRDVSVKLHRRNQDVHYQGGGSEEIVVAATRYDAELTLFQKLPRASRAIPDLKATLWVRCSRGGPKLGLHVVFPNQRDPKTGGLLSALIEGPEYSETAAGQWQQLKCETTERAMQNQIRLLRARFMPASIDTTGSYVDRVVVTCPLGNQVVEIFLDELRVGPLADFMAPKNREANHIRPIAEIRQGQFEVEGHPRLTRMVIDRGESLDTFQQVGANTVLVRHPDDRQRLSGLRERGIWAAAEPPRPPKESRTADVSTLEEADAESSIYNSPEILMWVLGTQITSHDREEVAAEMENLRRCDYRLRRPVMADVCEDERYFSRYVPILGTSRRMLGTSFSFKDERNWFLQRTKLATPGANLFTWIQTDAVPAVGDWRLRYGLKPAVVEPEQLRMQLYAAMSAGYRGFGYWTHTSLESHASGADERRLALTQLNYELDLVEPFLAAANRDQDVSFRIDDRARRPTRKDFDFVRDEQMREMEIKKRLNERDIQVKNQILTSSETEAAVFQGPYYKLVLVTWLAHDAQYVPERLSGFEAKVLIPEPSEVARFWEITTTGVQELKKEKTAGFYVVTLPKFDETAIILASTLPQLRDIVEKRAREMAPGSARTCIELAKAKLQRVRSIDAELNALGHGQPDGANLLWTAQECINRAEQAFAQSDFGRARWEAADAMQMMRTLQHAHWNEAVTQSFTAAILTPAPPKQVKPKPQPVFARRSKHSKAPAVKPPTPTNVPSLLSSPYTVCFQTLPDHWRLVERLGRAADRPPENVLSSGDFENQEAVITYWVHSQNPVEGVKADADLYPVAHSGQYALHLWAVPAARIDAPLVLPKPPVMVSSPPVAVRAGQVVYISGWIKLSGPISRSLDGVTIHDSIGDINGALRFTTPAGWQRFQMLRDVRTDQNLTLTIALHGMGEVLVDDLQVIPHDDGPIRTAEAATPVPEPASPKPFRPWSLSHGFGQTVAPQRPAATP